MFGKKRPVDLTTPEAGARSEAIYQKIVRGQMPSGDAVVRALDEAHGTNEIEERETRKRRGLFG